MEIQRLEGQGVRNRMANYSKRPKAMEPGGRKQLQKQKPGFQANMGVAYHYCLERGSMQQETGKVSLHKGLLFVRILKIPQGI